MPEDDSGIFGLNDGFNDTLVITIFPTSGRNRQKGGSGVFNKDKKVL
jgi:hypothetical protein